MTKRITAERVKKWGIGIGAVGIPLGILLIWFMLSLGAIEVTGYSRDVVCDGTESDPCYAYINFTAKEDIFIYPNESWSATPFYTDIQPKEVKMYRSWGKGWRQINLSKSCNGAWCGCYWCTKTNTAKFSYVFREGRDYQIKYKVLKNSPMDSIKWGFGPIDPFFYGWKDNILTYSNEDLTVNIKDALNKELGTITLSSHKSVDEIIRFGYGKEEVVMFYDFENWGLFEDGLGEVYFIDINTGKEIKKDYYFVEWVIKDEVIDDYEWICSDVLGNGTQADCYYNIIGNHVEQKGRWIRLENNDIPNRDTRIGLKTYVNKGDYIDAIWIILGKKIKKHATWRADLDVGLFQYWSMDQSSGTNVINNVTGGIDGTASADDPAWIPGKLGYALNFSEAGTVNITGMVSSTKDYSFSLWIKLPVAQTSDNLIDIQTGRIVIQLAATDYLVLPGGGISVPYAIDNLWAHIVFVMNSVTDRSLLYINGSLEANLSYSSDLNIGGNIHIGSYYSGTGDNIIGAIDEFGIWNRTLTEKELSGLYNDYNACAFGDDTCGRVLPTVNLDSPVNNTNFTITNNVVMNATIFDDFNISSVTLYLDNVGNETNSTAGINNSVYTFTKNMGEGSFFWTMEACDFDGECANASQRMFSVDTIIPLISIDYPVNTTYTVNVSDLNYTIIETNPDKCWYSKDSGATNSSLQTCMDNFTDIISIEGSNTWIIYTNDTLGNENQSSRTFFKDTVIPLISFNAETEANATILNQSFVYANVSVTEANEQNITFELYFQNGTLANSSTYTTPQREINWTGLSYATYLYNVTVVDITSNSNSTETRIIYLSDIFLFFAGNELDLHIELNTTVNITGNSSTDFGLVCVDIDHPAYGTNYTCSDQEVTLNLTFDYFRKTSFWNEVVSRFFNFTRGFQVDDENLTIESHQYDEVDDLRFNISSTDDAENVVFYRCNTTSFDRAYQGFLIAKNIYLNQSVNAAGDTFRNYENLTYNNPGNATVYFYLDDNATIINISMNVTGADYGFSHFDDFTNFSNIDVSETTAQLHYGPGGFIQSPNSSLELRTFDDFNDNSIAVHWTRDGSGSGAGHAYGVRETGGYLEAYANIEIGYHGSLTRAFYPNSTHLWFYASDYLSFSIDGYYKGVEDDPSSGCAGSNNIKFADQNILVIHTINSESDPEESTLDVDLELTKINNTYWEVNLSGSETLETSSAIDCDGTGEVVSIYNYTNGSIDTDWVDLDCTDTSVSLSNSSIYAIDTTKVIIEFITSITANEGDCNGLESYLRLDNLKTKIWNRTNGSVISESIFDSSTNIASSTINVSGFNGISYGNYSFLLWLSADNGAHYESVSNGVEHTFVYPGKNIKWKMDFNTTTPGYHNLTSILINVTIETPISAASDVEFDFGNDGIWDYKINGTFNETNNTLIISMPNADISSAFTSRRALYDHIYQLPLRISSETAGQINLNIFNITYDPNPVILNYSSIQTFLDDYGSNETNFTIPIGGYNGSVNVSDIKFDYAGGNDTIEIIIKNILNTLNVTRYIYPYYSRWDYMFAPLHVDFLEFIPSTPTSLNVTPYGQTNSTPIINLTNYGYGDKNTNLSVYLNETISCVNLTLSTTWEKGAGHQLNTSWIELDSDINYLQYNDIYMWADYNCDYNNWTLFHPFIYFRQCCDGCTCSREIE